VSNSESREFDRGKLGQVLDRRNHDLTAYVNRLESRPMYIYREFLKHAIIQFADAQLIQFSSTILAKRMMQRTIILNIKFSEKPNKLPQVVPRQFNKIKPSKASSIVDRILGRSRMIDFLDGSIARVIIVNIRIIQGESRRGEEACRNAHLRCRRGSTAWQTAVPCWFPF